MYVIAVNKSQEFLLNVRRFFLYICFDHDAAVFTSRCRILFDDNARDSTSTTSRCFFRRRRTLVSAILAPSEMSLLTYLLAYGR